jgi:hypothetical protein
MATATNYSNMLNDYTGKKNVYKAIQKKKKKS